MTTPTLRSNTNFSADEPAEGVDPAASHDLGPDENGLMPIFPPAVLPGMSSAGMGSERPEVVATADELHAIYQMASAPPQTLPPQSPAPRAAEAPAARIAEPQAPAVQPAPARATLPASSADRTTGQSIFLSDSPNGAQASNAMAALLMPVIELLAHRAASTPLSVGLLGPAGSGTSSAARTLVDSVKSLAQRVAGPGPFLSRVTFVSVEAAEIATSPIARLARALWDALLADGTPASAALAHRAAQSLSDPVSAARDAHDKVADLRRQLETERAALDDMESRRGRLADALLYDTAGSSVDSYARSNRTRIDGRMRGFGFKADTILSWKDLVAHTAERGTAARPFAILRSLWAYSGQTALIITGVLLLGISWGLGQAQANQGTWLAWLRAQSAEQLSSLASILEAHMGWFGTLAAASLVLGLAAFALNIWRALSFQQSLWRGAALLSHDITERRSILDSTIGHLTKRFDQLASALQGASDAAALADRRKADATSTTPAHGSADMLAFPLKDDVSAQDLAARRFLSALSTQLQSGPTSGPQRIVVMLDGLNVVEPQAAAGLATRARQALDLPGFALVIIGDGGRLARGFAQTDPVGADAALARLLQVPVHLDGNAQTDSASILQVLLGGPQAVASNTEVQVVDPRTARLDQPLSKAEQAILVGLSKALLTTPRHIKRLMNLYRLARCGMNGVAAITVPPRLGDLSGLALSLALDIGGTAAERQAYLSALASLGEEQIMAFDRVQPRLRQAVELVADLCGSLHGAEARRGFEQAQVFALPRLDA